MSTELALRFLARGAQELRESCPGEARYLLCARSSLQTVKGKTSDKRICPYCFETLVPGNHKVRLKPKMKMTTHIQTLLKQEARSCRLNLKQIKLLRKYKLSRSILVITCNMCKKCSKHPGETRCFLASYSPSTPKARHGMMTPELKKKPASGSKSNLSSPALIPRSGLSGHSSPSVLAKSSKKSKFHFSRLKLLLTQDEKEKSKKGDLQNFLSAL